MTEQKKLSFLLLVLLKKAALRSGCLKRPITQVFGPCSQSRLLTPVLKLLVQKNILFEICMKEIIITSKKIRKELRVIGVLLCITFIVNVFAIVWYKTSWTELYSSFFYLLTLSLVLYLILGVLRLILFLSKKMMGQKKGSN